MTKISLTYPDTGLTISIVVKNRDTWTTDYSGTMTEVGTTKVYKYDFAEAYNTDYIYTATVTGYSDMSWTIYRVGGWLTTEQDEKLTRIDERVDVKMSTVWSGIIYWMGNTWMGISNINDNLEKLLNKQKKELLKEIKKEEPIEKIDFSPILDKIDRIERTDDKIDKETLKKVEKIEKWIESEQQKEEDEKLEEEIERMKKEEEEQKEQKAILKAIENAEKKILENKKIQKEIQEEINKEEIQNILKLLK